MAATLRLDITAIRAVANSVGAASATIRPDATATLVDDGALASPGVALALRDSSRYRLLHAGVAATRFTTLAQSVHDAMDQVEELDQSYATGLQP